MTKPTQGDADPSRIALAGRLREARERKGMTVSEISRVTRIPSRSLELLEQGRFEELPGDVFVRGFLRSFAECVDLSADTVVEDYSGVGLPPSPVARHSTAPVTGDVAELSVEPIFDPQALQRDRHEAAERHSASVRVVETEPAQDVGSADALADAAPVSGAGATPSEEPQQPATASSTSEPRESSARRNNQRKRKRKRARTKRARSSAQGASAETQKSVSNGGAADATLSKVAASGTGAGGEPAADTRGTPDESSSAQSASRVGEGGTTTTPQPVLAIDDANPDLAEQERYKREAAQAGETLPAILASPPQIPRSRALVVAVVILAVLATIAMAVLMRTPTTTLPVDSVKSSARPVTTPGGAPSSPSTP